MRHIFKYTERDANTRQPLRRVKDIDGLRGLLELYAHLAEESATNGYNNMTAKDLKTFWTSPYPLLPLKTPTGVNWNTKERVTASLPQSPAEFLDGMLEKVNRVRGNDLSPRQCEGTETLSVLLSEIFNIPTIKFVEYGAPPELPDCFERPGDKK
jgi:hypothetical protein